MKEEHKPRNREGQDGGEGGDTYQHYISTVSSAFNVIALEDDYFLFFFIITVGGQKEYPVPSLEMHEDEL